MKLTLANRAARPRTVLFAAVAAAAVAGLLMSGSQLALAQADPPSTASQPATQPAAKQEAQPASKPTIVLEHGAWADASSWAGVIGRLQRDGYTVDAPPDPLRGLASDSATLADFLKTIAGPVILVGHSYGGAVITNAATADPSVRALVYVDAFIPAQGESLLQLVAARPGSCLGAPAARVFFVAPYPGAPAGDADLYLRTAPDLPYPGFAQCFANGLPASAAAVLAATQRPLALSAAAAPSGVPAWRTIPSWSVVGTADRVLPPAEQLFMSVRAHARITRIDVGHLGLISDPGAIACVIEQAAATPAP